MDNVNWREDMNAFNNQSREDYYVRLEEKSLNEIKRQLDNDHQKMYCVPPYKFMTWTVDYLIEKYSYVYESSYFREEYSNQVYLKNLPPIDLPF